WRYYRCHDVTIAPRPSRLPELWVSGGSRVPDPNERDVPTFAKAVAERIVRAGRWLSRCSGKQEWVKRDWQDLQEHARRMGRDPAALTFCHCNFIHLVDTPDPVKSVQTSKKPFLRDLGPDR